MKGESRGISRRTFLGGLGTSAAAFSIVPSHVLAGSGDVPPSEQVNIAGIGAGGQGGWDIPAASRAEEANIVALCDVDHENGSTKRVFEKFPDAKRFVDYRRMLDMMDDDIDAVVIATPDHSHFHATMSSLQLDKHVFCEKPLTHTIEQSRRVRAEAEKRDVVTQMGNQGHSSSSTAKARDWILDGAIGEVEEIWMWSGSDYFRTTPAKAPIPESLHYQLWLNRRPYEPFRKKFHPQRWRAWCHFGGGEIADMGCHQIDISYYSLDLGMPEKIIAEPGDDWPVPNSWPRTKTITWEFPERNGRPGLSLHYCLIDGDPVSRHVPRPPHMKEGRDLYGCGTYLRGTKASLMHGSHGQEPQILPLDRMKELDKPPKKSPRLEHSHWESWVKAIVGKGQALSDFQYGGHMTEILLLGVLALRSEKKEITWDPEAMKTNDKSVNHLVAGPEPRQGWKI